MGVFRARSLRAVLAGSLLFGCVAVASVIGGSLLMDSTASAQGTWAQATEITLPANAGVNPSASLGGISCWSAGNCTSVGSYTDSSGNAQAMAATETSGTWAQSTDVSAPDYGRNTSLDGVSCSSAGNCTSVGSYTDSRSGNFQAMAATETSGTWAQATEITAPGPGNYVFNAFLYGVSCWSAGNCTATGVDTGKFLGSHAMAATETSGTWAQATDVPAPPVNASVSSPAPLNGVSCWSAGNCTATGSYTDSSGNDQAMTATETSGTWAQPTEVTAPANAQTDPNADLRGVSCRSARNCTATGLYYDSSGNDQGMAATETSGTWAQATEVTAPANANASLGAFLNGVSCWSAGNCTATGSYFTNSSNFQAMAATETSGTWAQATEVTAPANAWTDSGGPAGDLYGVSCWSAGNCTATGQYYDSSGNFQAMAATETSGIVTVAFNSEGGAGLSVLSGLPGSTITLPSDTRPGYTLYGWYTAAFGGTIVGRAGWAYTIPSGGITLYAHWAAGAVAPTCPAPVISGSTATVTCSYNGTTGADGSAQSWTVPAGVTQATFDVYGAAGGPLVVEPSRAAQGGEATATLTVTPNTTLTVVAGGQGSSTANATAPTPGGFGGGGAGGYTDNYGFSSSGGGASSVAEGTSTLIVAGGGGGNAGYSLGFGVTYSGGLGGGLSGGNGTGQNSLYGLCGGGEGGTQTSGGDSCLGGSAGTPGQGGTGTSQVMDLCDSGPPPSLVFAGGGGGGGYFGGAGGGPCTAGGGGSGYIDPSATNRTMESGVNSGNGKVIITYTVPTVRFNSEGGAGLSVLNGPPGSAITLPPDTYTGHRFDGWFTAGSGGTLVGRAGWAYTIPSGGITLYAHWTANNAVTVAFNSEGGAGVSVLSGPPGSAITLPSDTRPGYTLRGWYTTAFNGTLAGRAGWPYTVPSGGITLYAYWTANNAVTVRFNSEGGAGLSVLNGPPGSAITLPSDTRPGYTLRGWYTTAFNGTLAGRAGWPYTVPSGGITLYAYWTANNAVTVRFNSEGGAGLSVLNGPPGSAITLPSDTRPGYTLRGWYTTAFNGTLAGRAGWAYTIPSGGITLYAYWTQTATPPSAPINVSFSQYDGACSFSWTQPTSDGGLPVLYYEVTFYISGGAGLNTIQVDASARGLGFGSPDASGVGFYAQVAAVNAVGIGPYSDGASCVNGTIKYTP